MDGQKEITWEDQYFNCDQDMGTVFWDDEEKAYFVYTHPDYDGDVIFWEDSQSAFVTVDASKEKLTWNRCLRGPDADEWRQRGEDEKNNFLKYGAVRRVTLDIIKELREKGCKVEVINAFALPQTKYNHDTGKYDKKVRIVADGSKQKYLDIQNTFSPTPAATTIRLIAALSAKEGLPIFQADVKRAFLQSLKENEKVIQILRPPPGVEEEGVYWLATHVVYGLREAPRAFHNMIKPIMLAYGLKQAPGDPCLWYGKYKGKNVRIVVQVDDFLVSAPAEWYHQWVLYMRACGIDLVDLGPASLFMNIAIKQSKDSRMVVLSQEAYAKEIVERCNLGELGTKATPLNIPNLTPDMLESCTQEEHAEYRRVIGEVMYLQTMTRPDLAQACSFLSQFLEAPLKWHLMEMRRMVRYIKGTTDRCIVYGGPHQPPRGLSEGELTGCVDASWEAKRSISGWIVFYCGGVLLWGSRKQKMTTLSTAEAEIVAASEATKAVLAVRLLLRDIGVEVKGPTTLFEDNQAAICFVNDEAVPRRLKHIDLRDNFVRDYVQSGDIRLVKIASSDNCADMFTKPLPKDAFCKHRDLMVTKDPDRIRIFPGEVPASGGADVK